MSILDIASYNSGEREPSCPYNNRMLHDRILRECPRKFGLPAHLWTVEDAHQLTCCANWPWNLIDNDSTITGVGHPKRNGLQTFSTVFAFGGEFGSVCLPSSLQPCRRLRIGKCPFRTRNADQS
ncbi:unnamed protein product (mitochondrion) [Plasmodiophora brassicae]|uniref:Uncharacterized protein n=1 Tax=Plasmodiophora brassicae TaxID=37360 RepID=A0A3P3YE12_PLABS|nr:unnamed protein product [Plasmodiophora brassicae]